PPAGAASLAGSDRGCASCRNLLGDERDAAATTPRGEEGAMPARGSPARADQDIVGAEATMDRDGLVARQQTGVGVRPARSGLHTAGCPRVEPLAHLCT